MPKTASGPSSAAKAIGKRAEALRKARGMTQDAASTMSGNLARNEISKLENGYIQAKTARFQTSLARAYNVPVELIEPYLHGKIELEDLLSHGGPGGYARLGNLEAALSYHDDARWAQPTIAAARAFALMHPSDPSGPEWAAILDRIEEALVSVGVVEPGGKPPSTRKC